MPDTLQLHSIPQVAETLGCSRTHVYELISHGLLRVTDIGAGSRSKSRVRSDDLRAYIDRQTREAPAGVAS